MLSAAPSVQSIGGSASLFGCAGLEEQFCDAFFGEGAGAAAQVVEFPMQSAGRHRNSILYPRTVSRSLARSELRRDGDLPIRRPAASRASLSNRA